MRVSCSSIATTHTRMGDPHQKSWRKRLMKTSTQITSLLLATMTLTTACDHKKSKDHKDDKALPANTAAVTAESLTRSQSLSRQLSPALARSVKSLSDINPADNMASLYGT